MARHLGWQQTRINKLEHGYQLPSPEDLDAWVSATQASPEVRAELGELLTQARVSHSSWAEVYRSGGIADRQADIATMEADTELLRGYAPLIIPGLLQTVAYARELLTVPGGPVLTGATPAHIEALIAERVKRQGLLYVPEHRVQVVLGQAALTTHFGTVATLLGQLDRLVVLSELPTVDLRVLPSAVACPILPLTGFWIDDSAVHLETLHGEQTLHSAEDVELYRKVFELVFDAALPGADAVRLIRCIAQQLRETPAVL